MPHDSGFNLTWWRETGVMVRKVCCCCCLFVFPSNAMSEHWKYISAILLPLPSRLQDGCSVFMWNICTQFIAEARNRKQSGKRIYVWLLSSPPPIPFFSYCSLSFFNSRRRRFSRSPPVGFILCFLARISHLNIPPRGITSLTSRDTHLNLPPRLTITFTRKMPE